MSATLVNRLTGYGILAILIISFGSCSPTGSNKRDETATNRRFVDVAVASPGEGTKWSNAFSTIDDALLAASSDPEITEIWIAQGTYFPADTAGIASSLQLQPNVTLFGGFRSGHIRQIQRAPNTYLTIINGAIGGGTPGEQVRHVVSGADGAILDGFTITNGHARDSDWSTMSGGGLQINNVAMTVRNCVFSNNTADADGGGILVVDGSIEATDCQFIENHALKGSGIQTVRGEAKLLNCLFSGNAGVTTSSVGGGVASYQASVWIERCKFSNNNAAVHGGGIWIDASQLFVTASYFHGNYAQWGGAASIYQSQADIVNCVFEANWGSIPTVSETYCGAGAINSNDNGDGDFNVINCTIVDNFAIEGTAGGISGVAIARNTNDAYRNCVFWGNHVNPTRDLGNAFYIVYDAIVTLDYCLFEGAFTSQWITSTSYFVDAGNNVTGDTDAGFVDVADVDGADDEIGSPDDGLHLLSSSSGAHSGLPSAITSLATTPERIAALATDIAGTQRITTGTICMGAYEMVMPVGGG